MEARISPAEVDFAAVFAALPGAAAVFAADAPDFTVLAASDALIAAAQRPRDAIVGRPLADAFPNAHPADPQASGLKDLRASVAAAVETGTPQHMDRQRYDLPRPDGVWEARYWDAVNIPVRGPDGAVQCVLHQTVEVTAHVRREEAAAQAERRAHGSESRLRAVLEQAPLAIVFTGPRGEILFRNAMFDVLWGRPPHTTTARAYSDVYSGYHLDGRPVASEEWPGARAVLNGEVVENEFYELVQADGRRITCWFAAGPIRDEAGAIAGGVVLFRDVTDERRTQQALRESEEKYRTLFETMDEGFALCELVRDARGRAVDYRYVDLNAALVRHGGITPDALRGRRATEVFPDLDPWLIETYTRVVEQGDSVLTEHYFPHVDRWLRINAFPRGGDHFAVLYSDVSERKRAEGALRASEARQAFLLRLADALRPLDDPIAIQVEAARVLGRHLGAGRAMYAEVEADDAYFVVHRDYTDGVPSLAGRHLFDAFGPAFERDHRAGRTLTVTDVARDERVGETRLAAFAAADIGAFVGVPLVKGGRLVASLSVHFPVPHDWSPAEVSLIEETAERTWAAVERARAEAALRESEERRLLGLDAAGIGDWSYDVATGILDCSPRARAMHGVGPGEPITLELHDSRIEPEDRAAVQAARARAFDPADGEYRIEFRFHPADGGTRCIESVGRGVFEETADGPRATHVIGAMIDVTERRQAEQALRESEQRYRTLFETMGQGYSDLALLRDADGRIVDERWLALNPAFERIFGVPVERAVGRRRSEIFPGLEPWWEETFDRVARSGVPERVEYESPSIGGWYEMWVYPRGGDRLIVLYEDVTERKRAEVLLREGEERQAFLLALSDALRAESDAEAIEQRAVSILAEHLRLDRCYVSEVFEREGYSTVGPERVRPGHPSMVGRYRLADYPETMRQLATDAMVVHDADTDPRFSDAEKALLAGLHLRALLVVALRKGPHRVVWALAAATAAPRVWTDGERRLLEETAERTWAAVERARADAALRGSEEQFRRAIEDAPIPVIMHAEDGQVLQVSRTWTELTGYALADVPTFDAWLTRAYGPGADAVREHMHGLFAGTRRTMSIDFPVRTRDGDLRHWSFSASAPGTLHDGRRFVVGMALDVTERRRADDAFRASEERLRTVIESLQDYAIITLDQDGRITSWNDGARRITGYEADEVLGGPIDRFYPRDEVAAGAPAQELQRALETGRSEDEGWRVRKDGSRLWVNEIVRPLRDSEGRANGFAKISRDLTERKAFEDALQQARESLEVRVRERTAEVQSLFTRLVSAQEEERRRIARDIHDHVGQQMTALRMNIASLGADAGSASAAERVRRTEALAEDLDHAIDFLTWELRPAALDHLGLPGALAHLVSGWSERFGIPAEFGAFGIDAARFAPAVETNLYRLTQEALHNVYKHARAAHVSVLLEQRDGRLMLVVEDDGRGFTVDSDTPRASGALGLINMRERATLAGGELTIDSTPGRGTTVIVRVPVGSEDGRRDDDSAPAR